MIPSLYISLNLDHYIKNFTLENSIIPQPWSNTKLLSSKPLHTSPSKTFVTSLIGNST